VKLWAALYLTIWVTFLEFLLSMIPQGRPWILYGHYGLGILIVGIAYSNVHALRRTTAPSRIKRIASATFSMSILMALLGPLLVFNVGAGSPILWGLTIWNLVMFIHVTTAFGIITQMAATAIAYDMWEDKEFLQESSPGLVQAAPRVSGLRSKGS
jgi:hypothetical protein